MKPMLIAAMATAVAVATFEPGIATAQSIPAVPPEVLSSPIVQSILQAVGGVLQTTNGNSAHGRVTFFRHFELQVETAPNVFREVHLHQGTIINPRGTTLAPGMIVDVMGAVQTDRSLNADAISAHP